MSVELQRLLDDPPDELSLHLDAGSWGNMMNWARATDSEVSGLGSLEVRAGELWVAELYLPPQRSNAIETELDPDGIARLLVSLVSDGLDPAALRLWWHSHAREKPFWSGLDERTISSFAPASMVSLVIDHQGQRLARVDTFSPRRTHWVSIHESATESQEAAPDRPSANAHVADRVKPLGGTGRLTYRDRH